MILRASTTYTVTVPCRDADGNAVYPDSVSQAKLYIGSTDVSTAMSLNTTPTQLFTGFVSFAFTTPADISSYLGKEMVLCVVLVIGTVNAPAVIVAGMFDTKITSDLNDLTTAQVNAEVDTALSDVGLSTTVTNRIDASVSSRLASASITLNAGKVTVGTNEDKTGYSISGTVTTLDSLNDITAQEVWEYVTRTLTSAGSGGATAQEVWEYATRSLTDKSGFSLTQAFPANFAALSIASDGDLNKVNVLDGHTPQTGDSYAVVTNATYGLAKLVRATTPANTLDIDANGEVTVGAFNSNLSFTTNQNNAIASYAGLALNSYGAAKTSDLSGLATASAVATVDNIVDAILVDTSTTLPAQLTSIQSHGDSNWTTATGFSTHSASDVWAVTTRALTDKANFALSTAGVSAVQSGMATASALSAVDTVVDAIKVSTDKFETMIILDGAVYQYTTNSLENAPSGSGATPAEIDAYLTDRHGSGSWQTGGTGSGANAETITITDGTSPLDGVNVWATTDSAGVNIVASGYTNASGEVTFMLDSGTYYVWQQLAGYNFTNPQTLVVS